nr:60S ribosomal protein L2, mitochondrial [Ipomoea batatas]
MMNPTFTLDVSSQVGSSMPLKMMRIGTLIHNLEMRPGQGPKLVRGWGTVAKIMTEPSSSSRYCEIKLPSGVKKLIDVRCWATIGQAPYSEHGSKKLYKAGQNRWRGIRPKVRGVAMNPVDHPHGGGEGKSKSSGSHGKGSRTPWELQIQPYFEDTKLMKSYAFIEEGATQITATPIKWKEDTQIPNRVANEKKGNKRPPPEESETQQKDEDMDDIHDEVLLALLEAKPPTHPSSTYHLNDFDAYCEDVETLEPTRSEKRNHIKKIFFQYPTHENKVHTATNLIVRKVQCSPLCNLCSSHPETMLHLLTSCQFASDCWKILNVMPISDVGESGSLGTTKFGIILPPVALLWWMELAATWRRGQEFVNP